VSVLDFLDHFYFTLL